MATDAQISANRANSQRSTGPRTEEGKSASSKNNFRYGFCGKFAVLSIESQEEFDLLLAGLRDEHQPSTPTERILVDKMAEHYWISRRAQHLQDLLLGQDIPPDQFHKELALYIRYQTTHDRAFHKSLTQLLKLKAERRKQEKEVMALFLQTKPILTNTPPSHAAVNKQHQSKAQSYNSMAQPQSLASDSNIAAPSLSCKTASTAATPAANPAPTTINDAA